MHFESSILQARIDMIGAACESAEIAQTLDKGQAAKIQEQENLLRATVNFGEGITLNSHLTFKAFIDYLLFIQL